MKEPISIAECCDCMDFMSRFEDGFFDLAIVDPPYGIGEITRSNSRLHKKVKWNDAVPDHEYFIELKRVSKHQVIWGINYYEDESFGPGRILWDKVGPGQNQFDNYSEGEIAYQSINRLVKVFRYTFKGNVQGNGINWNNSGIDRRIHPCQKPVRLYNWILNNYAKAGDRILDTHLGSQSSRIASFKMGFDFWGCEIDEDYFMDGCKRFEIEKAQQTIKFT